MALCYRWLLERSMRGWSENHTSSGHDRSSYWHTVWVVGEGRCSLCKAIENILSVAPYATDRVRGPGGGLTLLWSRVHLQVRACFFKWSFVCLLQVMKSRQWRDSLHRLAWGVSTTTWVTMSDRSRGVILQMESERLQGQIFDICFDKFQEEPPYSFGNTRCKKPCEQACWKWLLRFLWPVLSAEMVAILEIYFTDQYADQLVRRLQRNTGPCPMNWQLYKASNSMHIIHPSSYWRGGNNPFQSRKTLGGFQNFVYQAAHLTSRIPLIAS